MTGRIEGSLSKYLGIALMTGIVVGISFVVNLFFKPSALVVTREPDFKIQADKLFAEFTTDETAANKKYLNKVIAVSGEVVDITPSDTLFQTITLKGDRIFGVRCQLPETAKVDNVNIGDSITIKGLCTGLLMDVVLVKCIIENNH